MEKEPVGHWHHFNAMEQKKKKKKNTGNHKEKENTSKKSVYLFVCLFFFCNKIICFNLNDKIMKKEPVRMLTPF